MKKRFTPMYDRVVIERLDSSLSRKTTNAGILLPDDVKDKYKSSEGILRKCGEDCLDEVKDLIGKAVLFAKYSGDDLEDEGKDCVLCTQGDIFGLIEEI